jgi:subtilase family serine protease
MFRLAYRNFGSHESLVASHSVTAGGGTAVRWYEIRSPNGTPAVFQSGTFAPDTKSRWVPSIAMDQSGDIALGYSLSSSGVFPSIAYTGRVPTDALGTMEAETIIHTGSGSQTGGLSRWGDYTSMAIDPVDDCTFWYTNEYLPSNGSFNWATRIASFSFPSCGSSLPDIDTAPASLAFGNVNQGSSKDLAVTVRNIGTATLNVTSTTLLGTAEYSIVAGGGAFSLAPAATRQVTVRLTPTSLGSKVATLSFASNDTDENPKNVPLSGTGVALPDLVVSALTGPATAGAGFAITLTETTGNIGVASAGGTSTRYYLSSDTSIGAGDVLLGGRTLAGLAPAGSSAGATNVTIPAGTANGSYFIVARADDLNQALESNEGNNTRAIAIRIGPDLRVSSLTAPAYAAAGGTISISDTTANLSASSPAGASTTRFFLSTNTTLDAADIVIGSRAVPALASGTSSAGATPVTIPATTATGTYFILAKADGANVLAETNEANNVSARILRVGPDLVAAVRSIAGTPTAGATISVQDLTSDPSAVATPQSTTGYYLSKDNHLDAGDILIGRRTVPALAAGGSSLASAPAVIPAGTVPGAYFILAVADYQKVIVESNESNNANAFPITVP